MRIASRPFAPPDPDVRRLGADIPAAALAPGNLAGAALLGLPPSWPLLLAWATVAALMVIAQAVVHARHGGRGRPRARRAAATPRTRPVPPSAWSGDAPHRFDPTWFEPLADRMSRLLQDFLAAAVPRPGRPARIDLRGPLDDLVRRCVHRGLGPAHRHLPDRSPRYSCRRRAGGRTAVGAGRHVDPRDGQTRRKSPAAASSAATASKVGRSRQSGRH